MEFERAAELRDLSESLAKTIKKNRKVFKNVPELEKDAEEALLKLEKQLGLNAKPEVIECFDISHVSGTFVVASMVRFVNGKPDKKGYRRYKIKSFEGNDDFRSMEEVVNRRYSRLSEEQKALPDLVVVDGGLGQVTSATKALLCLRLESIPP